MPFGRDRHGQTIQKLVSLFHIQIDLDASSTLNTKMLNAMLNEKCDLLCDFLNLETIISPSVIIPRMLRQMQWMGHEIQGNEKSTGTEIKSKSNHFISSWSQGQEQTLPVFV